MNYFLFSYLEEEINTPSIESYPRNYILSSINLYGFYILNDVVRMGLDI
jgi:hypothetical protein